MKGGNGVRVANGITLCSNRAYQNDEAGNLHGWRLSHRYQLKRIPYLFGLFVCFEEGRMYSVLFFVCSV